MGTKDIVRLDDDWTDVPRPSWGTHARARLSHHSPRGQFMGEVNGDKQLRILAMSQPVYSKRELS